MAVSSPCYCTREDVKMALDFAETAVGNARIDRVIQSVARTVEGQMHRVFYPMDASRYFDWPNYAYAYPWRLWFDQWDLVVPTSIQSPVGVAIPLYQVFAEPVNRKPGFPFNRVELDRSTVAAWGAGPTPQHSILIAGTWGFTAEMDPAGTLAAAVATTTATSITVSDGSQAGVGDLLILNAGTAAAPFPAYPGTAGALGALTGERVLVTERTAASTGLTQSGAGCTTISTADNALSTTGTGTLNAGEVLLLDQERMLITDITGTVATVKRAWDGTVLAAHSAATVNAYRQLTVLRGQLGTAAATYSLGAAVSRHRAPSLIRDLSIGESLNRVLQETSGYARTVGGPDMAMPAPGAGLSDLWDEARTMYGRKARKRAI